MRKLFSSIVTLSILLLIIWAAAVWYFGNRTEQQFVSALENNNLVLGEKLFRTELLSYTKTLTGAEAHLTLSSDSSFISERIGDIPIIAELINGPVFFEKSDISTGSARWIIKVDTKRLSKQQKENLQNIFTKTLPSVIVRVDFDKKVHYFSRIKFDQLGILMTGIYDLESQQNRGAINIDKVRYGNSSNQLFAENVKISFQHQKAITSHYKPGTMALQIPELQINHQLLNNPVVFSVKANSNIRSENNFLNGFIHFSFKNLLVTNKLTKLSISELPIKNAELSLQFKQISTEGYIDLSEKLAELENLKQQAIWALEENGELPEGQDQIWQLYQRIDKLSEIRPKLIANTLFNDGKSNVSFEFKADNNSRESTVFGDIAVSKNLDKASRLISLIDIQAQVKLEDELYSFISNLIAIDRAQFELSFENNRLLMK
jgi:hypothetical protein